MKIAQIAPLCESVPLKLYGGTERIVSYLTEELVRQGHDVTLFASGDSVTAAKVICCSNVALRLNPAVQDYWPYHIMMMEEVRRRAEDFDVLHFHTDLLHTPLAGDFLDRTVTTLHGRLDLPDLKPFHQTFPDLPLVSISRGQSCWRWRRYPHLPNQLRDRQSQVRLLQDRDNLLNRIPLPLHGKMTSFKGQFAEILTSILDHFSNVTSLVCRRQLRAHNFRL